MLDFLLFSETKIKHDRETMTEKTICRYRVTSSQRSVPGCLSTEGLAHITETHDPTGTQPLQLWGVYTRPATFLHRSGTSSQGHSVYDPESQRYKCTLLVNSVLGIFAENLLCTRVEVKGAELSIKTR